MQHASTAHAINAAAPPHHNLFSRTTSPYSTFKLTLLVTTQNLPLYSAGNGGAHLSSCSSSCQQKVDSNRCLGSVFFVRNRSTAPARSNLKSFFSLQAALHMREPVLKNCLFAVAGRALASSVCFPKSNFSYHHSTLNFRPRFSRGKAHHQLNPRPMRLPTQP